MNTFWISFFIILGSIIIGLMLFFGSGLIRVKKEHHAIVERMEEFNKVLGPGYHYITPLLMHRVGTYSDLYTLIQAYYQGRYIQVKYRIIDFKTYHYSGHCFEEVLMKRMKEENVKSIEQITDLTNSLGKSLGLEIVFVKEIKK